MSLDDMLQADMLNVFTSSDHSFEVETLTYTPHNGAARTFPAQVFRYPSEIDKRTGMTRAARIEILVNRSATATVGITAVNVGVDVVNIATDRGGTVVDHPVVEVLSADAGGYLLRVE